MILMREGLISPGKMVGEYEVNLGKAGLLMGEWLNELAVGRFFAGKGV